MFIVSLMYVRILCMYYWIKKLSEYQLLVSFKKIEK